MTEQLNLMSPRPAPEQPAVWRAAYECRTRKSAEDEATKAREQGLIMRVREEIKAGTAFGKPYTSHRYIVEVQL